METFRKNLQESDKQLDLFTLAITRAHGKSHPEAFVVRELYTRLQKEAAEQQSLRDIFGELRKVTNEYQVPSDVCETYASVYKQLAAIDDAYHAIAL